MLRVPTKIGPSILDSIGLFTQADISKGEIVWIFDPCHDQRFRREILDRLADFTKNDLLRYSYINPAAPDLIVLCVDNARFLNFDNPANLELNHECTVDGELALAAARDIKEGEELTVPYESDADAGRKLGWK